MNYKAFINSSLVFKIFFVIALFLLIFISSVNYKHAKNISNSSKWVMQTYQVQMNLQKLHYNIKNAESNVRGYVMTKDSLYLNQYFTSKSNIKQSLKNLKYSISNNEIQASNLKKINLDVLIRLNFFEHLLNFNKDRAPNTPQSYKNIVREKKLHNSIDGQIVLMSALEQKILETRKAKLEDEIFVTPLFTLLLLFFSIFIFATSYIKINKDFSVLKVTNQNLMIANESINQAEIIGEFGTWNWDLKSNKLVYSDNIFNLLGVPPQSFDSNVVNFVNFVHPDDKQKLNDGAKRILLEGVTNNVHFRIIKKNGELRYFNSMGKTLTDTNGKKIIIGVTRDITGQQLSSSAMEERNFELEQTNAELESFNHVASHDLQEPLRKIQIFISRISPHDMDLLTETGKEYIGKIKFATKRMRTLIDDLLLFSQTNKSDKLFEKTDLNSLLENAKNELSIYINEKNAIINSDKIPTIQVIPFQIQQLFINIIHNFLKYSQPNVQPILNITCNKVMSQSITSLKKNNAVKKKYYKITFTDNGLGFNQDHAVSIFSIFKRLHSTDEFPGTGIGLAICKKIAENHFGTIEAEGKENIGASFSLYLPVEI